MSQINVSVIIPVYNVQDYLQDCIDSLLAQSLDNIEFIFINDASPDNCLNILLANQKKYPEKIIVIDSKENLCQGGARNLGIKKARGEYIGFVDSDDLVLPDMYNDMYNCAKKNDSDAVFVEYIKVKEKFKLSSTKSIYFDYTKNFSDNYISLNNKQLNNLDKENLIINGLFLWRGIYKRKIIIENSLLFPKHLKYEDNYWTSLMLTYLKKVYFINKVYYLYRQRSSSINYEKNTYHLDRKIIENLLLEEIKRRKIFNSYKQAWEYIYLRRYVVNTFFIVLNKLHDKNIVGGYYTTF